MADLPTDVVRLVTRSEREAAQLQEDLDAAHDEAIAMLERALAMVKERRTTGIAIAMVFSDGAYGRMRPMFSMNVGALLGAISTLQVDMVLATHE